MYLITASLVNAEIYPINEDRDGNLWFGSLNKGICKFDGNSKWTFFEDVGFIGNKINTIFKDHSDTLWIGSNNGLARTFNGSRWNPLTITTEGLDPTVHTIIEDREESIWFSVATGPENDVLYKYDRIASKISATQLKNTPQILSTIRDHNGYLWFGTYGYGVSRLHLNWNIFIEGELGLTDDNITGIDEDNDGNLWLATNRHGIARFNGAVFDTFNVKNNIRGSNFINTILVENNASIWCGTDYGAYRFNGESSWTPYIDSLANVKVNTIIQDESGNLWFGTESGVNRFDGNNWTTIDTSDGLPAMKVISIFEDHWGDMWFGTYGGGVCKFVNDVIDAVYDSSTGLIDNHVTSIIQDKDLNYWFGTNKGISRFNGSTWQQPFTKNNTTMANDNITCLLKDSNNNSWIGNDEGEVYRYDGKFFWDFSGHFNNKRINVIYQAGNKNLWFGTTSGLVKYIPDKIPPQTTIARTPDSVIGVASALFTFNGRDTETAEANLAYSWNIRDHMSNRAAVWSEYSNDTYAEVIFPGNETFIFSVKAKDADGNEDPSPDSAIVTVDITPPTTIITYPVNNDVITGKVILTGSAFDNSPNKDFKQYSLLYARGESIDSIPDTSWILINTLHIPVMDSILTEWITDSLHGYYFLKLLAQDSLNHSSEFTVKVNVVENLQTIAGEIGGEMQSLQQRIKLAIPPGALNKGIMNVHYNPVAVTQLTLPQVDEIQYSDMAYVIGPVNKRLNKPAALSFSYSEANIDDFDESKLSLARLVSSDSIDILGGIIDFKNKIIQTTIMELDTFILVEDRTIRQDRSKITDFNCQPRIFSPRGGLYSSTTVVSFSLTNDAKVSIKIYNLAGRLVRVLRDNETTRAGCNPIEWDGRDFNDDICPSDLYIVTIESENEVKTKTVVILTCK